MAYGMNVDLSSRGCVPVGGGADDYRAYTKRKPSDKVELSKETSRHLWNKSNTGKALLNISKRMHQVKQCLLVGVHAARSLRETW